eukprot:m.20082 g.20082  ORF g.20082 m.20082 type:complete len:76 (+) comp6747_c0_seq1:382-609(+)
MVEDNHTLVVVEGSLVEGSLVGDTVVQDSLAVGILLAAVDTLLVSRNLADTLVLVDMLVEPTCPIKIKNLLQWRS